jgi:pimeloyl-ACP methyl ester carboxylesterase
LKRWSILVLGIGLAFLIAAAVVSVSKGPVESRRPLPDRNTQFITVQPNVQLEVVDFGGTGRPLVLLPGYGGTAHSFPQFSTDLTTKYHVYGITQRGFGLSSTPASGYGAERLGDDVVAVIDALKLVRPVLVGESVAGEELSSVATFHPEKVAGLIYLDAGNWYALYDQVSWQPWVHVYFAVIAVGRIFEPMIPSALESKRVAILLGMREFTELHVPVLAIFADPHDLTPNIKDAGQRAKAEELDFERTERQANAFQRQVPQARIVRLPHASHLIFRSNEAEVVSDMNAFIDSLP